MVGIETALAAHAFEHLFIECLGRDRLRATTAIANNGTTLNLTSVAQKRGFTVFHCPAHRTVLANRRLLRDVQRQLRRSHHEHILIYSCDTPRKQVWQWATALADGRGILHREHPFFSSDPPKRLVERLEGLTVSLQEEEQTTLPDVLNRVRVALLPDSELNLFARNPSYAAESDRLAMAMKRGEPGSQQAFVQFHMPLARHSSKMLVRWFNMDPDDAEQTAMIGLMEAARRFDPERGYQFSTYAGYWIRNACQRYGLEWGLPLHVPTHYFWTCYKLEFIETELLAAHGQYEARRRFAEELEDAGISPEQWRHYQLARHFCRFSELDRRQAAKLDRPDRSPMDAIEEDAARQTVERALASLHPRHALVLKLRYGIGQPECTLQEIAERLDLTRERVRQIQMAAEKKLIRFLRKNDRLGEFSELDAEADEPAESLLENSP
jgi:RNA polymerase sigma factor (sigma-70 family)